MATTKDEEDFLSLDDGIKEQEQKNAAADNDDRTANDLEEDFLTLMPIDDGAEEQTNAAGDNDATDKSKRKRRYDKNSSLPPWMESYVDYRRVNPMVALHNEIVAFCKLMEPRDEEMKTREEIVARFTILAQSIFPDCKVEVFGSQATG